jgi:hypothetical protein
MALLFMDGFDAGDMGLKGWTPGNACVTGTSPTPRFGTGRWGGVNNGIVKMLIPASAQIFAGFSMANTYNDGAVRPYISLYGDGGTTAHLTVGLTNSALILYRGGAGATIIGQYNFNVIANVFYNIEIGATINATTGTVTVRMNGVNVITFTGNTKNGGTNTTIDAFVIGANGGMTNVIDDLYICDNTGSAPNNTFLGDVRIQTVVPSGAGSSTQFTPSTGANYTTVDELPYSATDYVQDAVSGHRDTYAMGDLPSVGTIYGVQNNVVAKKTDASAISLKPAIKSGASVYYGGTTSLPVSDITLTDLRSVDPNTSAAWTLGSVNALEAGFEVV